MRAERSQRKYVIVTDDEQEGDEIVNVQLQVQLSYEILRTLVRQLPAAERERLRRDLEMDRVEELNQRKEEKLAHHQQKVANRERFAPKDETYYQVMTPVVEALVADFASPAAEAIAAYEAILEGEG